MVQTTEYGSAVDEYDSNSGEEDEDDDLEEMDEATDEDEDELEEGTDEDGDDDADDYEDEDEQESEEEEDADEDADEGEDEGEDDEEDDEKGLFADEPEPGDGDDDDGDAPRNADDDVTKRRKLIMLGAICFCLVIVAVVLIVVLVGGNDDSDKKVPLATSPPTLAPVLVPTDAPVVAPTLSPTLYPNVILFNVTADTYIQSGEFSDDAFGNVDNVRVQNGDDNNQAVALFEFDLSDLPPEGSASRESQFILRLSHEISLQAGTSNITISKMPYNSSLDTETLTWDSFSREDGVEGNTFQVDADTEDVEVDITDLIRGQSQIRSLARLRGGRRLQDDSNTFLFMLETNGDSNIDGQEFRTQNFRDGEFAPVIIHNFLTGAPSAFPTKSPMPSPAPSISSAPSSSSAPTTSAPPSLAPSVSSAPTSTASMIPTLSQAPSSNPSSKASLAPSSSAAPSLVPSLSLAPSEFVDVRALDDTPAV